MSVRALPTVLRQRKRPIATVAEEARLRLSRNVRRLRVREEITQEKLALDARLQTAHVSKIELGLANPTVNVLARIARALHVDIAELWSMPAEGAQLLSANLKRGRKSQR